MCATYVYAIIPSADSVVFDVAGLDDDDEEVSTVSRGSIAAVIGVSPLTDYRGLQRSEAVRYLVAHQRVLECVMRDYPALPVKFGTVLPDEDCVRRLLEQEAKLFGETLGQLSGLAQMEVVVLWNLQDIFQQIGQEEPVARLKAQIASRPAEETMAERVDLGQLVKACLERQRAVISDRLLPALRQVAVDMALNPLMDDSMVINVALLLKNTSRGALDQRLEQLDVDFGGRLRFRCVGPLPPYNFATVEVQLPCFAAVDEARRLLGLGDTAKVDELKRAFHEMAFRLHPDLHPDGAEGQAPMAELTQAYRLLTAYAESVPRAHGPDGRASEAAFCRETVERTFMVHLRKQEARSPLPEVA